MLSITFNQKQAARRGLAVTQFAIRCYNQTEKALALKELGAAVHLKLVPFWTPCRAIHALKKSLAPSNRQQRRSLGARIEDGSLSSRRKGSACVSRAGERIARSRNDVK